MKAGIGEGHANRRLGNRGLGNDGAIRTQNEYSAGSTGRAAHSDVEYHGVQLTCRIHSGGQCHGGGSEGRRTVINKNRATAPAGAVTEPGVGCGVNSSGKVGRKSVRAGGGNHGIQEGPSIHIERCTAQDRSSFTEGDGAHWNSSVRTYRYHESDCLSDSRGGG